MIMLLPFAIHVRKLKLGQNAVEDYSCGKEGYCVLEYKKGGRGMFPGHSWLVAFFEVYDCTLLLGLKWVGKISTIRMDFGCF